MDLRALSDKTPEPQAEAVLLVPREVRFSVTYTAPDGTKHAGALVSVQLRDMPEGAATWAAEDDDLLFTLREECERHSAAWFRATLGARAGDPSASRVAITSSDPALSAT